MVDRTATRAGKKFESDLTRYLRDSNCEAERLHLAGAQDEGDIALWVPRGHLHVPAGPFILEAKRTKAFTPADWVKQAEVEAANYAKHRGKVPSSVHWAVVAARRNQPIGKAYVITTLDEWLVQVDGF